MAVDQRAAISTGSTAQPVTPVIPLLPVDKVFPIQIGSDIFRISYTNGIYMFFTLHSGENVKTLYIDRDPAVFKDIVRHLQGYLVTPRNEEHFVYLYSDAIYYKLPRLRQRLFRDFYVRIGGTSFQIPRELFIDTKQKGDSKNFFSMGFGSAMGSPFPDDKMFPQLNMDNFDAEKQLRPPYLTPPKLTRSATNFEQILNYMQGYELDIKSDVERRNLIKDSRFYNLRHLTETLIPAKVYHNPFRGNAAEILISVSDFRASSSRVGWVEGQPYGWMEYKRAHDIDKEARDLVVQIEDDGVIVGGGKIMLINRQAIKAVKTLKETAEGRKVETHIGALVGGAEEMAIRIEIPNECHCVFDGEERSSSLLMGTGLGPPVLAPENGDEGPTAKKRKLSESETAGLEAMSSNNNIPKVLVLKRSIWRVKIKGQPPSLTPTGGPSQPPSLPSGGGKRFMILVGVRLEGWTKEKEFSKEISWL